MEDSVKEACSAINDSFAAGGTLFACGNGGSNADAAHLVAEMTGKLDQIRDPKPAILLGASSASLTAIANDFGFRHVLSREFEALAKKGDVVICFSTSGESENIVDVVRKAHEMGVMSIGLSGKGRSSMSELSHISIKVNSSNTQTIQECHGILLHYICEILEKNWREQQHDQ